MLQKASIFFLPVETCSLSIYFCLFLCLFLCRLAFSCSKKLSFAVFPRLAVFYVTSIFERLPASFLSSDYPESHVMTERRTSIQVIPVYEYRVVVGIFISEQQSWSFLHRIISVVIDCQKSLKDHWALHVVNLTTSQPARLQVHTALASSSSLAPYSTVLSPPTTLSFHVPPHL